MQNTKKPENLQIEQKIILYVIMKPCRKQLSGNALYTAWIIQIKKFIAECEL